MAYDRRDNPSATFAIVNCSGSIAMNCNANDDLLTADTLGTVIDELIKLGILNGSVT